jgi:tRNA nucleotidyltransferase (CCA-adding enzyme)
MKEALDVVMAWQLRNPKSTDVAAAIEAVEAHRNGQTDSELPSRLASHFLQLTIPPFFPQNKPAMNAWEASQQPSPWKNPRLSYVLDLLGWSIRALNGSEIEAKWHMLVPPILRMIDDAEVEWKAKGCHLLNVLLQSLRYHSAMHASATTVGKERPSIFLQRTGYHNVFTDTLLPLFAYVPSLTPEADAVALFEGAFLAMTSLAGFLPTEGSKGESRARFLDKILREGVFSPLAHFPTPSTYPELATVILTYLRVLLGLLGIESVKHLANTIPLLSAILQEPLILTHKKMALSTLKALQAVILNAWPRVPAYRGAIMMGLCLFWSRYVEEQRVLDKQNTVETVRDELQETVAMLNAVMRGLEGQETKEQWELEKCEVVEASPAYAGMFDSCVLHAT